MSDWADVQNAIVWYSSSATWGDGITIPFDDNDQKQAVIDALERFPLMLDHNRSR